MKIKLKNVLATVALAIAMVSCTKEKSPLEEVNLGVTSANLVLKFDNVYGDADLNLNYYKPYVNSNGEKITVSNIKYIISNIVLAHKDGSTYTIPKAESYFIINEAKSEKDGVVYVTLPNIPTGDYTQVKFGIGVDKKQFEAGAEGQGAFLQVAQAEDLIWTWAAGYKFVVLEGAFTSETIKEPTQFRVHTGQTGTDYNYTDVTLDLPDNALIRTKIKSSIHIFADISKIIDGKNKFTLSEDATIMGGSKLPLVTENVQSMFRISHVHNEEVSE